MFPLSPSHSSLIPHTVPNPNRHPVVNSIWRGSSCVCKRNLRKLIGYAGYVRFGRWLYQCDGVAAAQSIQIITLCYFVQAGTLYGVNAHPNPRPDLISLYNRILHNVQAIPKDAVYRKSVESLTRSRLDVLEKETCVSTIVDKINAGLMEELIMQAEDEIRLIARMKEWQPWESLEEKPLPGQWDSVRI